MKQTDGRSLGAEEPSERSAGVRPACRGARIGAGRGTSVGVNMAAGVAAVLAAAGWAGAQQDRRLERQLRTAEADYRLIVDPSLTLAERTLFETGGFISLTYVNLQDSSQTSKAFTQYEASVFARASFDGAHTFFVRARFPYRDFDPGDSFDGRGDRWVKPFLDRYTYEFDYRRLAQANEGVRPDNNYNVRVGRQFVDWFGGLALSETLLAVRPSIEIDNRWSIEALVGVTPNLTTDFDTSRASYLRSNRRGYFGGAVSYNTPSGEQFYFYGLRMQDYNTDNTLRTPIVPVFNANFKYSTTYLAIGANGSLTNDLLYLGEFAYSLGESQSDPLAGTQSTEDVRAFAGRLQLTYLFRDERQSRLQFEGLFASGDSDRISPTNTVFGNLPGSIDSSYNALGFVNTGLAFAPSFSNLWTLRAGGATFPFRSEELFKELQVGADLLLFNKFTSRGGVEEPTADKMFLGTELDLYANWRLTSDLAFNVRYGVFFPGEAILSGRKPRQFVLLGTTLSF